MLLKALKLTHGNIGQHISGSNCPDPASGEGREGENGNLLVWLGHITKCSISGRTLKVASDHTWNGLSEDVAQS